MRPLISIFLGIVIILVFVQTVGVLYIVKHQNDETRTRYELTKQAVKDAMSEAYFAE